MVGELTGDLRLPVAGHAVTVADHAATAEIPERYADQSRVVAAAQRDDDRSIADAPDETAKHPLVNADEILDEHLARPLHELCVAEPVVADEARLRAGQLR